MVRAKGLSKLLPRTCSKFDHIRTTVDDSFPFILSPIITEFAALPFMIIVNDRDMSTAQNGGGSFEFGFHRNGWNTGTGLHSSGERPEAIFVRWLRLWVHLSHTNDTSSRARSRHSGMHG